MYKERVKRIGDILFSTIGLICFSPLFMICAFLIKLEDNGSVFYLGKRLGRNGKVFKMYKFRTMKMNAPDIRNNDGSTYNSENDNRLTSIGKFLRKTSLDEIPQLINVIIGEMSIVGPRPDLPEHIEYYNAEEKRKLDVLPGITGYNQAYFRNTIEWKERLKYDIYYVEHISVGLDIKIILKTIQSVVFRKGIYTKEK